MRQWSWALAVWLAGMVLCTSAPLAREAPQDGQDSAGTPTLGTVLARAGEHVVAFRQAFFGIIAEEHYRQRVQTLPTRQRSSDDVFRRDLRSDFLLVRPRGEDRYVEFRDVFEADGRPVRDREERLTRLFLSPLRSDSERIQEITQESARYNIGTIRRTLNTPTLALSLLGPTYQPDVEFSRTTDVEPALDIDLPADLWVVAFTEHAQNTLVHGESLTRLPATGRFWIDAPTGAVVASELVVDAPAAHATIDVRFAWEPTVEAWVPVEMREYYKETADGSRIDGTATYNGFRRFVVEVAETSGVENRDQK